MDTPIDESKTLQASQVCEGMERLGLVFSRMTLSTVGEYAPDDADWNFKDIPHLNFVHKNANNISPIYDKNFQGALNIQKILWFWFPMALVNYAAGPSNQVYYTNFLVFTLVIESKWKWIAPTTTCVETTYYIGSQPLFRWLHPFVRWQLRKNYAILTSEDGSMRNRRGELRKWGYRFSHDGRPKKFSETTRIMDSNLIPPNRKTKKVEQTLNLNQELVAGRDVLLGGNDHLGLRLFRRNEEILVFYRACPHEGASLDKANCRGNSLFCPWHNRALSPQARIDVGPHSKDGTIPGEYFNIEKQGNVLKVQYMIFEEDSAPSVQGGPA